MENNIFDNQVTLCYKAAQALKKPLKYVIPLPGGGIESVFDVVENKQKEGLELIDIYAYISERPTSLTPSEVAMIFYHMSKISAETPIEQKMIETINYFYDKLNRASESDEISIQILPLRDVDDLMINYRNWIKRYNSQFNKDYNTLETIIAVQNVLAETEPVSATEPVIVMVSKYFYPKTVTGDGIDPKDGIEIFNMAIPSADVPFIQYNDNMGKQFIRFYHGSEEAGDVPYYPLAIYPETRTPRPDTLCLMIFAETERQFLTRDSYVPCVYQLDTGILKMQAPANQEGEQRVYDIVSRALPLLSLGEGTEYKVRGFFDVKDVSVCEASFHDMILNDDIFRVYMYIDETNRSRADKMRVIIHYKSFIPDKDIEEVTGTGYISNTASVSVRFGYSDSGDTEDASELPIDIGEPYHVEDETSGIKQDKRMLRISIIKAESRVVLAQFLEVFKRLLRLYMDRKESVENVYRALIEDSCPKKAIIKYTEEGEEYTEEEISPLKESETPQEEAAPSAEKSSTGPKFNESKLDNLKIKAPGLFVRRYARKCQCPLQPIIIAPDEIKEWEDKTFMYNGVKTKRQIMPFPPPLDGETVHWYFVCPDDLNAFPTVKENTDLPNKDEFPYLPCCGSRPVLDNYNSNYYKYYLGPVASKVVDTKKILNKAKYRISTMKILESGRTAFIPKLLVDLLHTHSKEAINEDYIRYGVPSSPNSLIHCICIALRDTNYLNADGPQEKEKYVKALRLKIAENVSPLAYRQEMYDSTEEEIKNNLSNTELFLDPYLYYRGLEESFNINIFVFNPAGALHPLPGMVKEDTPGPTMEIPRAKITHIRAPCSERYSLIILKHYGAEANALKFPQCELIISRGKIAKKVSRYTRVKEIEEVKIEEVEVDEAESEEEEEYNIAKPAAAVSAYGVNPLVTTETTYVFSESMTNLLHETMMLTAKTYVWGFGKGVGQTPAVNLEARENPFSRVNWRETFYPHKIVGQRIDAYGKLRIVGMHNIKTDHVIAICVPPSQPMDVPYLEGIEPTHIDEVIDIFGQPKSYTTEGLWYSAIDYKWAIYIPVQVFENKTALSKTIEIGPPAPFQFVLKAKEEINPISHLRETKRNASLLVQMVRWAFGNATGNDIPRVSGYEPLACWWGRWVSEDLTLEEKPPLFVQRRLPKATSTISAINLLSAMWPNYFKKGKIHLPEHLYQILFRYFSRESVVNEGLTRELATHLDDLYVWEEDFIQYPNSVIFLSRPHFNAWQRHQTRKGALSSAQNPVLTKIDAAMALDASPFLYIDVSTGMVFIVQNVREGDKGRCLSACAIWFHQGYNAGFDAPTLTFDPAEFPHIIYGITKSQNLAPVQNNAGEADSFAHIVQYTENRYAALLPLL